MRASVSGSRALSGVHAGVPAGNSETVYACAVDKHGAAPIEA